MITQKTCRMIRDLIQYHLNSEEFVDGPRCSTLYVDDILFCTIDTGTSLAYSTDFCKDSVQLAKRESTSYANVALDCITFEVSDEDYDSSTFFKPFEKFDILEGTEFSTEHDSVYFQKLLTFDGSTGLFDCLVLRTYIEDLLYKFYGHISLELFPSTSGDVFDEEQISVLHSSILENGNDFTRLHDIS